MAEQDLLPSNREQRNEAQQWPLLGASLGAQMVKRLPTMRKTRVQSLGWEELLEKDMATHLVVLPGQSQGGRGLVGYSPLGRKESCKTELFHSL